MMAIPTRVVLMYHGIMANPTDCPLDREPGAGMYDVTRGDFRQHLQRIADMEGWGEPGQNAVVASVEKKVIITFDDGEMNNYQNAFALLREYGFRAYFFVTTERMARPGYMGPAEIRALNTSGMTIGSHGKTHRILTELSEPEILREMQESKLALEQVIRAPVKAFSVPRGFYDSRVLRLAKEVGYEEVFVSSDSGSLGSAIPRIAVKGNWTVPRFEMALRNEAPPTEVVADSCKSFLKRFLGPKLYDQLRTRVVKG